MQYKLHKAIRESVISRNHPISALLKHRQLPRIAIQRYDPLPSWSCGTFAMSTTLHLLLERLPPHSLPELYITRALMMIMYKALFEWLILGSPLDLRFIGRLHQDIQPPQGTHTGL